MQQQGAQMLRLSLVLHAKCCKLRKQSLLFLDQLHAFFIKQSRIDERVGEQIMSVRVTARHSTWEKKPTSF
jgi:hypothetical protein